MPAMTAPLSVSYAARPRLFGAACPLVDAIAREGEHHREQTRAEAQRISGTFYVDRLVGHIRTR